MKTNGIEKQIIAKGYAAIEIAAADRSVQLNKYTDPVEEAREDVSIEDAREIASEDPNLIYAVRAGQCAQT